MEPTVEIVTSTQFAWELLPGDVRRLADKRKLDLMTLDGSLQLLYSLYGQDKTDNMFYISILIQTAQYKIIELLSEPLGSTFTITVIQQEVSGGSVILTSNIRTWRRVISNDCNLLNEYKKQIKDRFHFLRILEGQLVWKQ